MVSKARLASLHRAAARATAIPGSPYRWDDGINGQFAFALWKGSRANVQMYLETLDDLFQQRGGPGEPGWDWSCTGVMGRAAWIAAVTQYPEASEYRTWFVANEWGVDRVTKWLSQPSTLLDLQRFERLANGEADLLELNRHHLTWTPGRL